VIFFINTINNESSTKDLYIIVKQAEHFGTTKKRNEILSFESNNYPKTFDCDMYFS
jgi:hypothetical protein